MFIQEPGEVMCWQSGDCWHLHSLVFCVPTTLLIVGSGIMEAIEPKVESSLIITTNYLEVKTALCIRQANTLYRGPLQVCNLQSTTPCSNGSKLHVNNTITYVSKPGYSVYQ